MKKSISCFLWVILATQFANAELSTSTWNISALALQPLNEQFRRINFLASRTNGVARPISAEVVLTSISSSFVTGDRLAVLGEAGKAQAVVIFDLEGGKELDWFFCYQPQRIAPTWLAYVEFYPAHGVGTPTDVILVYDLARSPAENRLDRSGPLRLPPDRGDYPARVGVPVFPDSNAKERSYVNEVNSPADSVNVLGPPFFLLLSSKRLVFLETTGSDYNNYASHLVAVDLSHGIGAGQSLAVPIPMDRLPRKSGNPKHLHALSLQETAPSGVRIVLPKADYGVDSLTVNIPTQKKDG